MVCRLYSWVGSLINFSPLLLVLYLLLLWELVFGEEVSRSVQVQLLQVLWQKYMKSSRAVVIAWVILGVSWTTLTNNSEGGFSCLALCFLLYCLQLYTWSHIYYMCIFQKAFELIQFPLVFHTLSIIYLTSCLPLPPIYPSLLQMQLKYPNFLHFPFGNPCLLLCPSLKLLLPLFPFYFSGSWSSIKICDKIHKWKRTYVSYFSESV